MLLDALQIHYVTMCDHNLIEK